MFTVDIGIAPSEYFKLFPELRAAIANRFADKMEQQAEAMKQQGNN